MEYIAEWEQVTERMAYWVDLDTAYVTRWHPLLDLRILAKTALVVLNCRGAC
jgi:lipopolysaccharide/colanic/teichoic acid biosynthesis glycosyltransferase